MNYFLQFLESEKYLPYVSSAYIISLVILLILKLSSDLKKKKLDKEFLNINKTDETKT
tara:strand:- start:4861 stop:5034 length:174 start_codon:yes stop_codon:yes gene_type:complete